MGTIGRPSPACRRCPGHVLALWAFGLFTHTFTLTAALPRLTHGRALMLSLTGSAVANVLPLGGAAGIALNTGWSAVGLDNNAFATYTVVTNAWDVLIKLALPDDRLPVVALSGQLPSAACVPDGRVAPRGPGGRRRLGRRRGANARRRRARVGSGRTDRATRVLRRDRPGTYAGGSSTYRSSSAEWSGEWRRLTLGMVAYSGRC